MKNELITQSPVSQAEVGNTRAYPGGLVSFLIPSSASGGDFSLFEAKMQPGQEPPLHMHEARSVVFYVLDGAMDVTCGSEVHPAAAGAAVLIAPQTPHTYRVTSETARFLVWMQPSLGIESYFEGLSTPVKDMSFPAGEASAPEPSVVLDLAQRHGVTFLNAE